MFNFLSRAGLLVVALTAGISAQARQPFYTETMNFRIEWKGIRAGDVTMRSRIEGNNFLTINAKVNSLPVMHGIYYVQGVFAAKWNFASRSPVIAYEEAYQGDTYQRRKFRFWAIRTSGENFDSAGVMSASKKMKNAFTSSVTRTANR